MRRLRFGGGTGSRGVLSYLGEDTVVWIHRDGSAGRIMDARDPQVQAVVQQLVMEHGEYSPLELLLAANRLRYSAMQAGRTGRASTGSA